MDKKMKIVVKVGTSLITDKKGLLDNAKIHSLAADMAEVINNKQPNFHLLLVSSGAIAAGIEALGMQKRPTELSKLQAAAAVGQGKLLETYSNAFQKSGLKVAQVLLTQHDTAHREQYLNARHTLKTLVEMGVIPIINENDSVATEEIIRGDNDTLAGLVANIIEADMLIILSDVDGLFSCDPSKEEGCLLPVVEEITPQILEMAGGAGSHLSKGGMVTKLQAAEIANLGQSETIIANGNIDGVLKKIIIDGQKIGTSFKPAKKKLTGRKLWIGFSASESFTKGTLIVDEGAKKALTKGGKSLLPAGIKSVFSAKGYRAGDIINLAGDDFKIFARGVSNYSSEETEKIKGRRSDELDIEIPFNEVIHRDDLVILPITQQVVIRK
jgi:glutamate 5-kinase